MIYKTFAELVIMLVLLAVLDTATKERYEDVTLPLAGCLFLLLILSGVASLWYFLWTIL